MKSMNARSARRSFFLASLVVALLALSTAPLAQVGAPGMWKSYAAKFVCGAENGVLNSVIATGKYFTVVNIHNPHYLMDVTGAQVPAVFFKKVVVALPQGNMPLRPSCKQFEALSADHALSMDCFTIKTILRLDGLPFQGDLEGFMVIEVPPQPTQDDAAPELDVVAVYNARPRLGTDPDVRKFDVTTMDVERIVPTNIIGVPNQDLCSPD